MATEEQKQKMKDFVREKAHEHPDYELFAELVGYHDEYTEDFDVALSELGLKQDPKFNQYVKEKTQQYKQCREDYERCLQWTNMKQLGKNDVYNTCRLAITSLIINDGAAQERFLKKIKEKANEIEEERENKAFHHKGREPF